MLVLVHLMALKAILELCLNKRCIKNELLAFVINRHKLSATFELGIRTVDLESCVVGCIGPSVAK